MAFGFGFNKQKVLSAAEKYVQQGKLQNAIAEYDKILKHDAKDLTVANTVGDLYARNGEADKATECFKAVGDAYATQGFTVKAIAMYKKLSKLKPSLESVLKLAELYTQQGLFNDARAQYLQVAEEFLKSGELENAVRIFQKILEMDPENVNMRVRLAEVYIRLGKKDEAWQIFSAAAENLRSKGSLSAADEVLQRMLKLDPNSTYALVMQGKNLVESGDAEGAIASFEKISDLDSNPDGLRDLLKAYIQVGRLSDAGTIANKLLTVHNDLPAISGFADALMQAGQYETALQVYDQHAERLLAENSDKVLQSLHTVIGHVRENPASLEKLLALFHKAGENTHISEVYELLAHASVQAGDMVRARDLYQKLASLEPQNPLHMANYQQVVSQIGGSATGTKLITAEEAAVIVDELEATAPSIHQHYPDEVALAVRSALTDAELFVSYNMPAKALGPLVAVLPQAPTDLRLNQRLAALHTRAGRFAEAAVCCRTLQNIYSEAEYPEEATRYGELADRYEERSSALAAALPAQEIPVSHEAALEVPLEAVTVEEADHTHAASPWPALGVHPEAVTPPTSLDADTPGTDEVEFAVVDEAATTSDEHTAEIDLSSEWEDSVTVEAEAPVSSSEEIEISDSDQELPTTAKIDETIDEIRFYLSHGMPEQAWAGLAKLQTLTRDEAKLATIRAEVEAASQAETAEAEPAVETEPVEEVAVEEIAVPETTVEDTPALDAKELPAEELRVEPVHRHSWPAAQPPAPVAPEMPVVAEASAQPAADGLKDFVTDLESSLGETFLPGAVAHPVEPTHAAHAVRPEPELAPASHGAHAPETHPPVLGEFVADLEASLGNDFLAAAPVARPEPAAPVAKPQSVLPIPVHTPTVSAPLAASAAAAVGTSQHVTAPPVASAAAPAVIPAVKTPAAAVAPPVVEPQKGKDQAAPVRPQPAPSAAKASPFADEAGVDLSEMFGELKHDLEADVASADEDPETHYNLGIAFREMGLLDEAIGELQKACQSVDRGHAFPQIMQACTWLAQCFLEKGVPEAAVRWYEKALNVPGIDGETRVALHYELASAFETAGDKPSALKHFMDVYGNNIDYRDVTERIKALKS
jgi:tetratricopeptide (TPR) repeat protein